MDMYSGQLLHSGVGSQYTNAFNHSSWELVQLLWPKVTRILQLDYLLVAYPILSSKCLFWLASFDTVDLEIGWWSPLLMRCSAKGVTPPPCWKISMLLRKDLFRHLCWLGVNIGFSSSRNTSRKANVIGAHAFSSRVCSYGSPFGTSRTISYPQQG